MMFSIFILLSLIFVPSYDLASAIIEAKKLEVKVEDIRLQELENSNLLRVVLNILNGGDEEATFFENNFDLLDNELKQYGAISGYNLRDKGENISRGACDILFGDSVNPGLSTELEVCFEIPKNNFQYDSILIYGNMFLTNTDTAKVVPLVENSIGYDTFVNQAKPTNPDIANRADDLESKGGCLIATAAYGTELASEVQNLREIRNKMYETESGGKIMHAINDFYYSFSPTVSDWERENVVFKETVKLLITPSMASFAILDHEDIDSENGLISYVVGIVALNMGMYFITPVMAVIVMRKLV